MSRHADVLSRLREVVALSDRELDLVEDAVESLETLVCENEQLRNALAFYADPVNYENATPRHVRPVITDRGMLATRALGAGKWQRGFDAQVRAGYDAAKSDPLKLT